MRIDQRTVAIGILAAVAYVILGRLSLLLASVHVSSSPVWPPAGFAIGLLIIGGLRLWPAIFVGAFLVNYSTSGDWLTSAAIAGGNTGEAVLAAWIVIRFAAGAVESMAEVFQFLAAAVMGAVLSATIGVGALLTLAATPADLFLSIWQTWVLGNLAGTLIIAPLMLAVVQERPRARHALTTLGAFAFSIAAFWTLGWSLILLVPAMAWLVVRENRTGLTLGMLALSSGAVLMTLQGTGPFWGRDSNDALILLQVFVVAMVLTSLTLSAGLRSRDQSPNTTSWTGVSLALAPIIAAAAFVGVALHPAIATIDEQRKDAIADEVLGGWVQVIETTGGRLTALKGLYEASPEVSRQAFDEFVQVQGWEFGAGGITAVGFVRTLNLSDLPSYEAAIRNDTAIPAVVAESFGVFPPPSKGPVAVVEHVYPLDPQPGAIGLNLRFEPQREAVLDLAISSGEPVATEPVQIISPAGNQTGLFVAMAVQGNGSHLGFVVLAQTVEDAAAGIAGSEFQYRITDTTSNDQILYSQGAAISSATATRPFSAWGRSWELEIATPATTTSAENAAPWFILAAGGTLSVAMAAVVYAHDSTRARAKDMSEQMIAQTRTDLMRLAEIRQLEDRDEFRRDFLNMVAHELRTPLTPIRTQAYLLKRRARPEDEKGFAILDRGITRLAAVVDDLLIAAKLDAGELSLQKSKIDVYEVAREAVEAMQDKAKLEGTKLTLSGTKQVLEADGGRLGQVIDNLLTNAMKFAPEGTIDVSVIGKGDEVHISVKDDGIGISRENIAALGQPFMQAHEPGESTDRGTGLGLYICKAIAKLHDGILTISSPGLGKGSTVTLRLPRRN